jgi:hypothetical protein
MSVVAAAIIGGSVVTAYSSSKASSKASKASAQGADAAAQAQILSTEMQVDEMARQFDYQQQVLQPQIQQQFNAQRAYSDLLGIGGPTFQEGVQNQETGYVSTARSTERQQEVRDREIEQYQGFVDKGWISQASADREIAAINARPSDQEQMDLNNEARRKAGKTDIKTRAEMGGPGSSGLGGQGGYGNAVRGPGGGFVDPNLNRTQLADTETLSGTVQNNLLAGTSAEDDPFRNFITDTSLDAGSLEGDMVRQDVGGRQLAAGAAGTDIYGAEFTESPGYAFQREEMERQLERTGSAGGPNIGGRAIIEGQRRAQGLAAGDYYNWAQGRSRDVDRMAGAEATDISRMDKTAYNYQDTQRREQGRGDAGYQDYLRRTEGDASRLDAAASNKDRLAATDLQRQDQGYYNYLNSVAKQAGFGGGPAATAVQASQAQAGNVAGAYRNEGNALSLIAGNQGTNQANIAIGEYQGYNNAIQGGLNNWMTYQNSQPVAPVPTAASPSTYSNAGAWSPAAGNPGAWSPAA